MVTRSSERSEKAKGLGHASGEIKPWAWTNGEYASLSFDYSAECWREEVGRAWTAESPARRVRLVVGAVVCAAATIGWVGWVVWLVVGKG